MTCQDLKRLDFSNGMEGYQNVRIPTLREVYGLLKNTSLTINVEVKCDVVIYYGIWNTSSHWNARWACRAGSSILPSIIMCF